MPNPKRKSSPTKNMKQDAEFDLSQSSPSLYLSKFPEQKSLFRGDLQPPEVVFKDGFQARGQSLDVLAHVNHVGDTDWFPDSGYVATSQSREVALKFPWELHGSGVSYVYAISPQAEGVYVAKALYPHLRDGHIDADDFAIWREEREIAIPGKIDARDIKGAWPVDYICRAEETVRISREGYVANPYYQPNSVLRVEHGIKIAGKALTYVGVALDGSHLYRAYQASDALGNFDYFWIETGKVSGGWAGAIPAGIMGARIAATSAAPFGPYVAMWAGVVGGVTGSIAGYIGGSALGEAVMDNPFIPEAHAATLNKPPRRLPMRDKYQPTVPQDATSVKFKRTTSNTTTSSSYYDRSMAKLYRETAAIYESAKAQRQQVFDKEFSEEISKFADNIGSLSNSPFLKKTTTFASGVLGANIWFNRFAEFAGAKGITSITPQLAITNIAISTFLSLTASGEDGSELANYIQSCVNRLMELEEAHHAEVMAILTPMQKTVWQILEATTRYGEEILQELSVFVPKKLEDIHDSVKTTLSVLEANQIAMFSDARKMLELSIALKAGLCEQMFPNQADCARVYFDFFTELLALIEKTSSSMLTGRQYVENAISSAIKLDLLYNSYHVDITLSRLISFLAYEINSISNRTLEAHGIEIHRLVNLALWTPYVNLYLEHVEEAHQLGLAYQPPRIHNLYSISQHMLRFLEVLRRGDVREAVWRNYQQALTQAEAAVNQTIIDANRQLTESARNGTTLEIFDELGVRLQHAKRSIPIGLSITHREFSMRDPQNYQYFEKYKRINDIYSVAEILQQMYEKVGEIPSEFTLAHNLLLGRFELEYWRGNDLAYGISNDKMQLGLVLIFVWKEEQYKLTRTSYAHFGIHPLSIAPMRYIFIASTHGCGTPQPPEYVHCRSLEAERRTLSLCHRQCSCVVPISTAIEGSTEHNKWYFEMVDKAIISQCTHRLNTPVPASLVEAIKEKYQTAIKNWAHHLERLIESERVFEQLDEAKWLLLNYEKLRGTLPYQLQLLEKGLIDRKILLTRVHAVRNSSTPYLEGRKLTPFSNLATPNSSNHSEPHALFIGQKALQFKLSRASHSKPKSAPSSTSDLGELMGMVRELLRENKEIKQQIKQLQARSSKDPTGLGLGAEACNPSWHCKHSSIDSALCVPANGAKVYRHMHRLVPNSWDQLDPTLTSCTPIRYLDVERQEPSVQYCKGPEIEYVEENYEGLQVESISTLEIVGQAALQGAAATMLSEAVGDLCRIYARVSKPTEENIKWYVNTAWMLFSGNWASALISSQTSETLKQLGVPGTASRIAGNAAGFFATASVKMLTPVGALATVTNLAAGFFGLKVEKKIMSKLEERATHTMS